MADGAEGDAEVLQNYTNFYNKRLQEVGVRGPYENFLILIERTHQIFF